MKKRLFLIPFLFLGACKKPQTDSFRIPLFQVSCLSSVSKEGMFLSLSARQLEDLLKDKASFLLFIPAEGCNSCDAFFLTLKNFVKNRNVLICIMDMEEYLKSSGSLSLSDSSLLFYSEGRLKDYKTDFKGIFSVREFENAYKDRITYSETEIINDISIDRSKSAYLSYSFKESLIDDFSFKKGNYLFSFGHPVFTYDAIDRFIEKNSVSRLGFFLKDHSFLDPYIEDKTMDSLSDTFLSFQISETGTQYHILSESEFSDASYGING